MLFLSHMSTNPTTAVLQNMTSEQKSHRLYLSTQPCLLCKGPSWLDQQTVDTPHRRTRVSGPSLGHLVTPPRHSYAVLPQLHMNVVWEVLGYIGWGSEWKRSHLYCYGEAIMHAGWGHHNAAIFWSLPSCLVTSHPYSVKKIQWTNKFPGVDFSGVIPGLSLGVDMIYISPGEEILAT